jgi:hypothetical protein
MLCYFNNEVIAKQKSNKSAQGVKQVKKVGTKKKKSKQTKKKKSKQTKKKKSKISKKSALNLFRFFLNSTALTHKKNQFKNP